jgi:hypothetical protein
MTFTVTLYIQDEKCQHRAGKKRGDRRFRAEVPAASHTDYPEPGDSLPLFFFPQPPHGLVHPR